MGKKRGSYVERSKTRDNKFFGFLELMGVTKAAQKAGYSKRTVYHYREIDDKFRERWDDTLEIKKENLEDEAERRAYGYVQDIYFNGKVVGQKKVFSDLIIMFLLKKYDPSYRDNHEKTKEPAELLTPVVNVNLTVPEADRVQVTNDDDDDDDDF